MTCEDNVIRLPAPPSYIRTTVGVQLWRSRAYVKTLRQLGSAGDVLVYNNIITSLGAKAATGLVTLGFINDDNNIFPGSNSGQIVRSLSQRLLHGLERRASRQVDAVIVNSKRIAQDAIATYGLDPADVFVLYKGTKVMPARTPPRASITEPLRILFVKSDWRRGGLADLVAAVIKLRNFRPIQLDVVGPPKAQLPAEIQTTAVCHGPLDQAAVQTLMAKAHIFCVPAHAEALGVANMEAMVACIPVIATDVGGIPEVTNGGRNCWQVRPGQHEEIVEKVKAILDNPMLAQQRVREAYNYVTTQFNIEDSVNRLTEIITEVKHRGGQGDSGYRA